MVTAFVICFLFYGDTDVELHGLSHRHLTVLFCCNVSYCLRGHRVSYETAKSVHVYCLCVQCMGVVLTDMVLIKLSL